MRGFSQAAVRALLNYDFPGNIRELQNLVERAVITADTDGLINLHHLFTSGETLSEDVMTLRLQAGSGTLNLNAALAAPDAGSSDSASKGGPKTLEQTEAETLQRAITAAHGNLSAAARLLNTTRPKLAYRARRHGLIG